METRPIVIDGAAVVTLDPARREFATGHVVAQGNRIVAVGSGPTPAYAGARVIDGRGCWSRPASSTLTSTSTSG
jgi:cytosine/adenosine deaminase-related metal-dependent hydrolase